MKNTSNNSQAVSGLEKLLADSYTLYLKTHKFHWNVTGPQFVTLHQLFEQQYMELALAVDAIAERIRAMGAKSPGSYKEFSKLTSIQEEDADLDANAMIQSLLNGHQSVIKTAREVAHEPDDEVTQDLITQRLSIHEKTAWMLRSLLGQ